MKSYYNTTNLQGQKLKQAKNIAVSQEDIIEAFFTKNRGKSFTPCEVHDQLEMVLTSVRRAITVLTSNGVLEKTEDMREGVYGRVAHTWKLSSEN